MTSGNIKKENFQDGVEMISKTLFRYFLEVTKVIILITLQISKKYLYTLKKINKKIKIYSYYYYYFKDYVTQCYCKCKWLREKIFKTDFNFLIHENKSFIK